MAADKWHHVEGTHPRAGLLRVYVYDNFTEPLDVKRFSGRAVTNEIFDSRSAMTREVEVARLSPSRDGKTLEARIKTNALPARLTLKMKFDPRLPEERFDFTFDSYSKEPPPPVITTSSRPATPATRTPLNADPPPPEPPQAAIAGTAVVPSSAPTTETTSAPPLAAGTPLPQSLPQTSRELLALLAAQTKDVETLIEQGQFPTVYVPAMLSKNVALALEGHTTELSEGRRSAAVNAIKRVVLGAWQLDTHADLGNREKLTEANRAFSAAVADLIAAYAPAR